MKTSQSDSTRTLFLSARRFFSGTFLSRLSGMARDISMTFAFGTKPEVAAFLLAFRLAHLCRRLFGEGALQSAFVPLFEDERTHSTQKAHHFFLKSLGGLTGALTIVIALTMLALYAAFTWLPLSADNQQIAWLTFLMMPSLLFICLYGLNAAFLNCEKVFFMPGVSPVFFNLIWILFALNLQGMETTRAVEYLSLGVILGCMGQWIATLPSIKNIFKKENLSWGWRALAPNIDSVRRLAKPLFWGVIGIAASQINNTLDVLFAWYAHSEGPAYLWYAIRLQQLPLALFGVSLAGALLPPLTRAIKESQPALFFELLQFTLEKTFALMIPLTFATLALGACGINLIYGRGLFTQHSTIETAFCLWGYGLGLLPMALVLILAAVFYAEKNYRIPMISSVLSMLSNLLLNAAMVGIFEWGPASVALATSISAWINVFYLFFSLPKHTYVQAWLTLRMAFLKISAASMAAFLGIIWITHFFFQEISLLNFFNNQSALHFPRDFSQQCLHFFLLSGGFFLLLTLACWILKSRQHMRFSPLQK